MVNQALPIPKDRKAIVFKAAHYWFAVPIATVVKVVNFPPELRTILQEVGFVSLGEGAIALFDIERTLKVRSSSPKPARFLIIVRLTEELLCAIPVDSPPALGEIDSDKIRELRSRTAVPPLNVTSQIAPLDSEASALEVFLLDFEKLLKLLV